MTDRQTQTDRHTNIRNNNKAHSLRDVTQQTELPWHIRAIAMLSRVKTE